MFGLKINQFQISGTAPSKLLSFESNQFINKSNHDFQIF